MKNTEFSQLHFHPICVKILSQLLSPSTFLESSCLSLLPGTQVPMALASSESQRHLPPIRPWPAPTSTPRPWYHIVLHPPAFLSNQELERAVKPQRDGGWGRWATHTHISMNGAPYAHCPQCHSTTPPSSLASVSEV